MSPPSTRSSRKGVAFGLFAALIVAAATIYLSCTQLKPPQVPLDWAALVFSGLTTGIIAFFVVWGHFQDSVAALQIGGSSVEFEEATDCPKCGSPSFKYHPVWTIVGAILLFPVGLLLLFLTKRRCLSCRHTFQATLRPKSGITQAR